MYAYEWEPKTGGYALTLQSAAFVSAEIRPVYAEELMALGFDRHFVFDVTERRPLCWARQTVYYARGQEVARLAEVAYGKPIEVAYAVPAGTVLRPVDTAAMAADPRNTRLMEALVAATQRRLKAIYDTYAARCDLAYIAFSCGKDSAVLLDLCHRTLPFSVPVVFSETGMDLPGTEEVWEAAKWRYPERTFILARAEREAVKDWEDFGPPSQKQRWCCTVRKSAPTILRLREVVGKPTARFLAFVGVRGEESARRATYTDVAEGAKSGSQVNGMPILDWGAHEIFLYAFANGLALHPAYRQGVPRVGCLVCPMATLRQTLTLRRAFPAETGRFETAIAQALDRPFVDVVDRERYIVEGGWRTRCSGQSLRMALEPPETRREAGGGVTFVSPAINAARFREWLKTVGDVVRLTDGDTAGLFAVRVPGGMMLRVAIGSGLVRFVPEAGAIDRRLEKALKAVVAKAMVCVGCGACAAECPAGAIVCAQGGVRIDAARCMRCRRCHAWQDACVRFHSIRYSGGSSMELKGINKYTTFGLRPEWVQELGELRERFGETTKLGTKMIPAAKVWFYEAGLTAAIRGGVMPTALVDVATRLGAWDSGLWEAMWMALANRSALARWFVVAVPAGQSLSHEAMEARLEADGLPSPSSRRGALSSLFALLKQAPLGAGSDPLVAALTTKGNAVTAVRRLARAPKADWTLLFGLFVMAEAAGCAAFSVSALGETMFPVVSPLVAFGMTPQELMQRCRGLEARYGDFIRCSFTHGLDQIALRTDMKTFDDVAALAE